MFQAATGLRERGHDVTVISRPDAILERRCQESGVEFIGLRMRNQFDLGSARELSRMIRRQNPDVIHVHKGVAHALALAATWSRPVPAFVVNRGVSFPLDIWNRGKFRTRRVDRIVAVCEQIRQIVIASAKLPPEKVIVIYAGTDVGVFDPAKCDPRAFRREKNISDDRFLVAQVGVRDWKGWQELIQAAADVAQTHREVHLALIGCRPFEIPLVMDYASQRGIGDRISAIEYRADMPNVFASCDLVVDASWAGTGITGTIREAMSMQKPVIATDCGGNAELVSSRKVGWLVPPRDVPALAAAMREVVADHDRAAQIGRQAREQVIRGFSKNLRILKLERLYSDVLAR